MGNPLYMCWERPLHNKTPHNISRVGATPHQSHAHNVLCGSVGRKREEWTHDDPNLSER
jgi:hypothetical protein